MGPGNAVEGDGQICQDGVEGIGDLGIIRGHQGFVAEVLEEEGVGDLAVAHDLGGTDGFGDRNLGTGGDGDSFCSGGGGTEGFAGDGNGVDDRPADAGIGKFIGPGLVDQYRIGAGGDGDAGKYQGWSGGNGRGGLGHTAHKENRCAVFIGQRIQGGITEGVAPQIVGNGEIGQSSSAGVAQGHHIGHQLAGLISAFDGGFGGGEHLQDLAVGDVGGGSIAVVSQGSLVGKDSHSVPPGLDLQDETACIPEYAPPTGFDTGSAQQKRFAVALLFLYGSMKSNRQRNLTLTDRFALHQSPLPGERVTRRGGCGVFPHISHGLRRASFSPRRSLEALPRQLGKLEFDE